MFYIIGDIHGCHSKLKLLFLKLEHRIMPEDTVIFLGDYIDRGEDSFAAVDYLSRLNDRFKCVFLTGNHEKMLFDFLKGLVSAETYYANGGKRTIESYTEHLGQFMIPDKHKQVLFSGRYYFEGDDFIAVHAGVNPEFGDNYRNNPQNDMIWIRENFFNTSYIFAKTVIFGHTPTAHLKVKTGDVFADYKRNMIGIDTAAVYGGKLTCLVWPEKEFIQC